MPDIPFDLPIAAPPVVVYEAIATPQGLERWWALRASGEPRAGARY